MLDQAVRLIGQHFTSQQIHSYVKPRHVPICWNYVRSFLNARYIFIAIVSMNNLSSRLVRSARCGNLSEKPTDWASAPRLNELTGFFCSILCIIFIAFRLKCILFYTIVICLYILSWLCVSIFRVYLIRWCFTCLYLYLIIIIN